ncbi:hypothetical protein AX16_003941 [Volvariella volvacea WC 439]|nr:hypothetical protein AX16_003941 [Volvariella volvacea WC 439]
MYSKSILGYCVAGVILMISLLQAGAGLGVSVSYVKLNRDPTYVLNLLRVSTVWLVSAMVCDWTITIALVLLLWNARNKTVLRRTSTTGLLDRLIISTVETGAVTSMASLLELVFFLRLPYTFLYTAVLFVIGRLYTNVLLASLNGRLRNQQIADNSHTIEISLSIRHLDRSSQSQDTSNQVHQKQQSKKSRRDIHSKRDHKHDQDSDKPTESRGDTIHDSMTSSASASASGTSGEKRLLRKGTGTRVTFDDLDVDDVSKNAKFLRTDYTDSLGVSSGSSSVYDAKGKGKESSVEVTSSYTESRTTGSRGMHSQSGG